MGDGQIVDEVIEGRAKVMQPASNDETKSGRRCTEEPDPDDIIASITVGFINEAVRISF